MASSLPNAKPGPDGKVPDRTNDYGWLAVGVPGILAGLQLVLDRFGTRRLDELARPAIARARDGFPLPADAIDRDRMLRRRLEALQMRQHANPRRDDGRKLSACHDRDHIRHTPRFDGVDANDFCMGMRRAQEHHMRHARQLHVADIKPASLHQPLEIGPRNHLADV